MKITYLLVFIFCSCGHESWTKKEGEHQKTLYLTMAISKEELGKLVSDSGFKGLTFSPTYRSRFLAKDQLKINAYSYFKNGETRPMTLVFAAADTLIKGYRENSSCFVGASKLKSIYDVYKLNPKVYAFVFKAEVYRNNSSFIQYKMLPADSSYNSPKNFTTNILFIDPSPPAPPALD